MKTSQKINSGFSIHCHHDELVEYCYDYAKRVAYIKREKPKEEQSIRLKVFKILPEKASLEIPKELQEAYKAREEAYKAWEEAYKAWREAYKAWEEAYKAWEEAYKAWPQKAKDKFHKKWCGCKYWDGKELVFRR